MMGILQNMAPMRGSRPHDVKEFNEGPVLEYNKSVEQVRCH